MPQQIFDDNEEKQNFLNKIPGLRSHNKAIVVLSSIYYLLCFIPGKGDNYLASLFSMFSIPFVFGYGLDIYRARKNQDKQKTTKATIAFIAALIVFFVSGTIAGNSSPKEPEDLIESSVIADNSSLKDDDKEPEETSKKDDSNSQKAAPPEAKKEKSTCTFEEATISRNIDGDTVEVNLNGQTEKIRMIGVDTPETKHPNKPVQYFGKEASAYTAEHLAVGTVVWLQTDVTDRDRYGRILRYIWTQKPSSDDPSEEEIKAGMYNALLVMGGYAVPYTYPPDVKYSDLFKRLSQEARENGWGLWGAPEGTPSNIPGREDDTAKAGSNNTPSATGAAGNAGGNTQPAQYNNRNYTADTTQGQIKGNKRSMIYHSPGQQGYNKISVNNVVYFNSAAEAEAAGYRAAKR